MNKYLLVLILFLILPGICLAQINITVHNSAGISGKHKVPDKSGKKYYLGLGDEPTFLKVQSEGTFRISQQVEYSISLMNEGPHLDLTDWKHAYSKWYILKKEKTKFLIPKSIKKPLFPKTSSAELVKEVRKQKQNEWVDVAKNCKTVNDYPCSVSPSLIKFKIEKKVKSKWIEVGILKLFPAMGC